MNWRTGKIFLVLLLYLLLAGLLAGCVQGQPTESEQEQDEMAAEPQIDTGIVVSGTTVTAAGKTLQLAEKNSYIRSIVSCHWIEKNKIAVECSLSGVHSQPLYFTVYDVVRNIYVYEQYGKQFIWQNDDLDTLLYVVDYAGTGEGSQVLNRQDVVLYTSDAQQQIQTIAYVPKGIKVEVSDRRGEHRQQIVVETAL